MKVSELINILKELQSAHGNCEVYQKHPNGVFGKVKGVSIAFRSKSSPRDRWIQGDEDKGQKVIKI